MKQFKYFFLLLVIISSCKQQKVSKTVAYNINGTISKQTDSTLIFLDLESEKRDSSYIINGKFHFTGKLDKVCSASISNNKKTDSFMFWLDNSDMQIVCKDSLISNSIAQGSVAQDLYNKLNSDIDNNLDKINKLQIYAKQKQFNGEELDKLQNKYSFLQNQEININKQFIKDNSQSIVSIYILNQYKESWEIDTTKMLYDKLAFKETSYGKEIQLFLKSKINPQIGDRFVDFEIPNDKGELSKISQFKDKYILLDFWASWCSSCRALNPTISGEYEKYKDSGLEIIGISLDKNIDRWKKAIREDKIKWTNLCDLKGNKSKPVVIYKINNIPNNILIDKNGIIIARNLEPRDLKNKLKEIFED